MKRIFLRKHLIQIAALLSAIALIAVSNRTFWRARQRSRLKPILSHALHQNDKPIAPPMADENALPLAVQHNNAHLVKELLGRGSNPNSGAITYSGFDKLLLQETVDRGNLEIAQALLDAGAKADDKGNEMDDTALASACGTGNARMVSLLLKYGADPNSANHFGGTPLDHAISSESPEVVALLIAAKVNVNAKDLDGRTPLDSAKEIKDAKVRRAMRRMLMQAGAK